MGFFFQYRKIPKISPTGLTFFKGPFWGAYFWRGLSTKGNLRFKIDWASLIVGSKFTVFVLFYFIFEGNFPSKRPREAGGLIFWGLIQRRVSCVTGLQGSWRGLFSEFYGISSGTALGSEPFLKWLVIFGILSPFAISLYENLHVVYIAPSFLLDFATVVLIKL